MTTMQPRMRMSPDEARMLYHIEKERRQKKTDALIDEARDRLRAEAEAAGKPFIIGKPKRAKKTDGHQCGRCRRGPDKAKFHRIKTSKSGLSGLCVDCIRHDRNIRDMERGVRKRERYTVSGPHFPDRQWCVEDTKREKRLTWFPTRKLARARRDELNGTAT